MSENTREIVLDTLLELERGKEYSHRLIKAVLDKYDYLDNRDKAFIKRVTEGTTERRLELDYYLNYFSSLPVRKMKPLVRCLLRMSVYQILYMDSIPDSAVCNEACKLAVKRKFVNLKGFVNGVLRTISRQKEKLPMPDPEKEQAEYFSVKYSMPRWITEMWLDEYGSAITATLLEGLLKIHPVSLRFRTGLSREEREELLEKLGEAGVRLAPSPYLPYVYSGEGVENISALPGFVEGLFTVQDVSSALAVEAAGISKKDFVMDVCAAPGGKTLLAAEKAAKVLSRDVSETKVSMIEENLRRMGLPNVTVQVFDARFTDEAYLDQADILLLDVPCSGLGILGKKRDIKYNASLQAMEDIGRLQKEILEKSWRYVKPGGILLYSTCTVNRAENEEMVRYISENLPFDPEDLAGHLPAALLEQREKLRGLQSQRDCGRKEGSRKADSRQSVSTKPDLAGKLTPQEAAACIQLMPGYMESDGFFIARFRRRG